ncbi:MAG: hypothetical protein ABEJ69_00145 [Candidatus Nanohaloarchaea archaeon]
MDRNMAIAILAVAGVAAGFLAGNLVFQEQQSYYDKLEDSIMQNKTFNGTVDCFSPEEIEVNVSERVEKSADVRAVCRHSYRGKVQWFNVAFSN